MLSHQDNGQVPDRRRRQRRSLDHSLLEDLCEDTGKTLHSKDGRIKIYSGPARKALAWIYFLTNKNVIKNKKLPMNSLLKKNSVYLINPNKILFLVAFHFKTNLFWSK